MTSSECSQDRISQKRRMRPAGFLTLASPAVFVSSGLIEIGLKLRVRSLDLLLAAPFPEGLHCSDIRPMRGCRIWPSKMLNDLAGNSEPVCCLPAGFGP